jgi:hypothetical protein
MFRTPQFSARLVTSRHLKNTALDSSLQTTRRSGFLFPTVRISFTRSKFEREAVNVGCAIRPYRLQECFYARPSRTCARHPLRAQPTRSVPPCAAVQPQLFESTVHFLHRVMFTGPGLRAKKPCHHICRLPGIEASRPPCSPFACQNPGTQGAAQISSLTSQVHHVAPAQQW